jgi:hypothetical protein
MPSTWFLKKMQKSLLRVSCKKVASKCHQVRLDKRIFGIETEFGVTCTFQGQRRLTPDEVAATFSSALFLGGEAQMFF